MISSCMFSSAPIDGEEQRDDGNGEQAAAGNRPDERADEPPERAEPVDDDPGATHENDDGDDIGGLDESSRHGDHRGERTDRRSGDLVIGAGHDDPAAGRRIVASIELARGSTHVSAAATTTPPSRRMSGCGMRSGQDRLKPRMAKNTANPRHMPMLSDAETKAPPNAATYMSGPNRYRAVRCAIMSAVPA